MAKWILFGRAGCASEPVEGDKGTPVSLAAAFWLPETAVTQARSGISDLARSEIPLPAADCVRGP